jgi:hypothetical protein
MTRRMAACLLAEGRSSLDLGIHTRYNVGRMAGVIGRTDNITSMGDDGGGGLQTECGVSLEPEHVNRGQP